MWRLLVLCCAMVGGVALAQTTTGSVNPNQSAPQPAAKDDVPPGGCMPMGVTASGEIVFPLECKAFLEQHRDKDPKQEPAAAEIKPSIDPKPSVDAKPSANEAPLADVQPPVAVPQKSAARDEAPPEKQPEATVEKQPEAPAPKQAEVPATKDPETTTAAKEPEAPAAKEPEAPAAKEPEAPAQKQSEAVAPEQTSPTDRAAKPVPSSKHAEDAPRPRTSRSPDCVNYRSYDASSGTYRDYSGHTRPCR